MADLQFLHMSDTHFLKVYQNALEKWGVEYNPTEILEGFLKTIDFTKFDFVVHTGDLVHDGELADYQSFKELMETYIPEEIPVFYCLGNHDKKRLFHQVFNGEDTDKKWDYISECKDYQLIFLDSSSEEMHDGVIDLSQAEWLKAQLEANRDKEILIFQHHPLDISWINGLEKTQVPDNYDQLLNQYDIKGIFTGHLHQNRHYMVNNRIPQHTANSLVFGMTIDDVWNNNRLGYSVVKVVNGNLDVYTDIVNPVVERFNQNIL